MNTAYLIIGGNKGNKLDNLKQALLLLGKRVGKITKQSDIFITAPWGKTDQPDFYNQAVCIETDLSPYELLNIDIVIEEELGRIRTDEQWMERTMDIDILFFNNDIINTPDLKIPHPYIQDRRFVLVPLKQIASELIHPKLEKSIKTLLLECLDVLEVQNYYEKNPS